MYISAKTGEDFEQEFFGPLAIKPKIQPRHLDFIQSLRRLRHIQSRLAWNPKKPSTPAARKLFTCVKKELGFVLANEVSLYCAIGTSADYHHGFDGVFACRASYVPFDLTIGKKRPKHESYVMITKEDFEENRFQELGLEIATRLCQSIWQGEEVHKEMVRVHRITMSSCFEVVRSKEGKILKVIWTGKEISRKDFVVQIEKLFPSVEDRNNLVQRIEDGKVIITIKHFKH